MPWKKLDGAELHRTELFQRNYLNVPGAAGAAAGAAAACAAAAYLLWSSGGALRAPVEARDQIHATEAAAAPAAPGTFR